MGLLDDAIRDHLDLKRRHGAAPEEVERAEREALGPVRRGPEDPGAEPLGVDQGLEDEHGPGPDELTDDQLQHGEELPYGAEEEEWAEWDQEEELPSVPGADAARTPEPPIHEREPEPEPPAPETEVFDHGEETAEYDVEDELKKESRRQGDEILEE